MKSKNWSRRSVLVCGVISLAAGALAQPVPSAPRVPALAVIDVADAAQWQTLAKDLGWRVITAASSNGAIDTRVMALTAAVQEAVKDSGVDPARIYLAGRGDTAAIVF